MKNKKIDIEMADMIGKTYFKVATWFNQDFDDDEERKKALKSVSAEIIQMVLEDTFLQIEGIGGAEVKEVNVNDVPEKVINQTSGGTGKMFQVKENTTFINKIKES